VNKVGVIAVLACLPFVLVMGSIVYVVKIQPKKITVSRPPLGAAPTDQGLKKGYDLFTGKGCVYCHGPEGKGGTKNPNAMGGEVPSIKAENFTQEEFIEKLEVGVRHVDKAEASKAEPPLYMPSWKARLTHEEMGELYKYLSSFAPKKKDGDEW